MKYTIILLMTLLSGCFGLRIPSISTVIDIENDSKTPLIYTLNLVTKVQGEKVSFLPFEISYTGHWAITNRHKFGEHIGIDVDGNTLVFPYSQSLEFLRHTLQERRFHGFFIVPGVSMCSMTTLACVSKQHPGESLPEKVRMADVEYECPASLPSHITTNKAMEIRVKMIVWPCSKVSMILKGDCFLSGISTVADNVQMISFEENMKHALRKQDERRRNEQAMGR